jgi:glycosyltransferase involved in cell wall biosynthesis
MVRAVKRLLLIAYYFPPAAGGGVARALSFARHLPRHGWEVTVVAADPASAPLRDGSRGEVAGLDVHRVSVPALFSRSRRAVTGGGGARPSGLYRFTRSLANWFLVPDSFAPWRKPAAAEARRLLASGHYHAVLTTSPPDTVQTVGLDLASGLPIPWIADFRDPWVSLSYRKPPTAWHAARQEALRRAVLERADMILATTGALADHLRDLLPERSLTPVHHLSNGWEDDFTPQSAPAPPGSGLPEAVYTGTLWDVPAAHTCLEGLARSLRAMKAGPGVGLRVRIVGPHESTEVELVRGLGLGESVIFEGQVPYAEARAWQARADVLLLLQVHGEGYEVAIPGKLYEYIASGRPILAFLGPGEAADLVRRSGGWVVDPDDAGAAEAAFSRLLAGERPGGDSEARRELAGRYRRDRIAARLAAHLDTLASGRDTAEGGS